MNLMQERYDEEDEEFNIFFELNEYADCTPSFKSPFLDGVRDFYYRAGFITFDQLFGLRKMYKDFEKFKKSPGYNGR